MRDSLECWKASSVFGYEVSDAGRVRCRLPLGPRGCRGGELIDEPRPVRPVTDARGYLRIAYRPAAGRRRTERVHVLVLHAFVGPRPPGAECCHNNGDRSDNRLSNLRYGTRKENAEDRSRHGTEPIGSRKCNAKLTESTAHTALWMLACGVPVGRVAWVFGVHRRTISGLRMGRSWRHVSVSPGASGPDMAVRP